MLPKMMLDFLMEVWENPVVEMSEERWNYVEYLKIFGFLAYRMGNSISDEPNQILVVDEMKDRFYFLLKSRKTCFSCKMAIKKRKKMFSLQNSQGDLT